MQNTLRGTHRVVTHQIKHQHLRFPSTAPSSSIPPIAPSSSTTPHRITTPRPCFDTPPYITSQYGLLPPSRSHTIPTQSATQHSITPRAHHHDSAPQPQSTHNLTPPGTSLSRLQPRRLYQIVSNPLLPTTTVLLGGIPLLRHGNIPTPDNLNKSISERLAGLVEPGDKQHDFSNVSELDPGLLATKLQVPPTLDEYAEADKLLKLAQIKRRAILEQDILDQYRENLPYHERKRLELREQSRSGLFSDLDGSPTDDPFATTHNPNATREEITIDQIFETEAEREAKRLYGGTEEELKEDPTLLTPEERKFLLNWDVKQRVDAVVVNHFVDDLAFWFRSWCCDKFEDISNLFWEDIPWIFPHYIITPYILRYIYSWIPGPQLPHVKQGLTIFEWLSTWSTLFKPLRYVPFDSGHWQVDLRCAKIAVPLLTKTLTFTSLCTLESFPWIYNTVLKKALYPLAWAIYKFAPRHTVAHVIRVANEQEQLYKERYITTERADYIKRRKQREENKIQQQQNLLEQYKDNSHSLNTLLGNPLATPYEQMRDRLAPPQPGAPRDLSLEDKALVDAGRLTVDRGEVFSGNVVEEKLRADHILAAEMEKQHKFVPGMM